MTKNMAVSYCQFISCMEGLISGINGATISYCEFYNCQAESNAIVFKIDGDKKEFQPTYITHCVFDGIKLVKKSISLGKFGGFIACKLDRDGRDIFIRANKGLSVNDCTFRHCSITESGDLEADRREYINETYKFSIVCEVNKGSDSYSDNDKSVLVNNCTGLDNVNNEGFKAENVPIRYKTSVGELIGVDENNLIAGVDGV
jgi:hypothetical protein